MHFLAGGIQNHGPKLAFIHFSQIFQQNVQCLKLIRKMSLFWNSIFYKLSFKCKTQFLEHQIIANVDLDKYIYIYIFIYLYILGTLVPCKVLEFMELKFHLNFFKELEFHELEYFTWNASSWNSSSNFFFFLEKNFNSL